jgi:protein-S-isoprenylcysteine O-methyltransferase Ste14
MSALQASSTDGTEVSPPRPTDAGTRMDLGRLVGVPIMVGLTFLNAATLWHLIVDDGAWSAQRAAETLARVLSIAFYLLLVSAFMRRTRAKATHPSVLAAAAALTATWLPFAIPLVPHGEPSLAVVVVANILLIAGLGFSIWSIRFLDRSFSMVAQARAVVRTGPYAHVRHPLYTGELCALLGTRLAMPGWAGLAVWATILGLQVYRARHEESILATTLPDYSDYQASTPQLMPRVLRRAARG